MAFSRRGRELLVGLALMAGLLALTVLRLAPPAPKPANVPSQIFSAARAFSVLSAVVGDGKAHPSGSEANARVRERIKAELKLVGLNPQMQSAFTCGRFGTCAAVENVLARIEGRRPGKAVLLMAHHDSVAAGPGAADDGAGVAAVLEIARILKSGTPPLHPVIILLTDGEEAGLIGSTLFHSEHPWARDVAAVVNLESRGTSGPSLMFETTGQSGRIAPLLRSLARPVASSAYVAAYAELRRRAASETDLTAFRPDGSPGVNFAFIGDVGLYHSSLDDVAHLCRASLQHEGENGLAMVRALAESDLEKPGGGRVVYFDLLGWILVSWPESWSLPMALFFCAAMAASMLLPRRRHEPSELSWTAFGWGLLAFVVAPTTAVLLSLGALFGFAGTTALPQPWIGRALPTLVAFWSAGLAGAAVAAMLFARRAGPAGLWAGTWTVWAGLALASAYLAPGACYLFLLPAAAASIIGAIWAVRPLSGSLRLAATLIPAAIAALVLFPVIWLLLEAAGLLGGPLTASLVALVFATLSPLANAAWRGLLLPALPTAALVAASLAAAFVPAAYGRRPELVTHMYHLDADLLEARWLVHVATGELPLSTSRWAAFSSKPVAPFPWGSERPCFVAVAPRLDVPAPELEVLGRASTRGGRRIHARLRSLRKAASIDLFLPPDAKVESIEISGKPMPVPDERVRNWYNGWQPYRFLGAPEDGLDLTIILTGEKTVDAWVVDETPGLPPSGASLAAERPISAGALQDGDTTYLTRRVAL